MTTPEHGGGAEDDRGASEHAGPGPRAARTLDLASLVGGRQVVVCCGSGGVGKTTTAAAIALHAATLGLSSCVVTIDPARRLADALGTLDVANVPHVIDGPWPGQMSAVMLDAKGTFDDLVHRYARDGDQARRILANRLYQNLVSALSGTQEYMATEKLFELYESGDFDLVVVDTPPSRSALDFLDAPRRLAGFLDNRVLRALLVPGRAYMKAMSVGTHVLLRTIGKVAGGEIVEDTVAFFQAFEGMEQGFRDRAARVERLLEDEGTGFVVVAAPRRDSVDEATFLADELAGSGHHLDAIVVNRVHPDFGPPLESGIGPGDGTGQGAPSEGRAGSWDDLASNLADMATVVSREQLLLGSLAGTFGEVPLVLVPTLDDDVHDLDGLTSVARHLAGVELP